MSRNRNHAIVTDSAEGPEYVKVSVPGGGERLVSADDPQGVREALDDLAGEYDADDE